MKITKKIPIIIVIVTLMAVTLSVSICANYFIGDGGTHDTYINTYKSFSSFYYTDENPTLEYRYKNLTCDEENATLSVSLYARKIKWSDILSPSQYKVGTKNCSGLNATDGYWYGWTYENIDCSSSGDITSQFASSMDEGYNIRYYYEVANNNGKYISNDYGEWQVICSYSEPNA